MSKIDNAKDFLLQAFAFFGISGIGWLLDFCTYTLLGTISDDLMINNTVSSWVGATFVFVFATKRLFENNSRMPLKAKYLIYLLYQLVLILGISKLLACINTIIIENVDVTVVSGYSGIISKILVTPITMVMNFIVMKYVIEKI